MTNESSEEWTFEKRTPTQIDFDNKLANWRKHWAEEHRCYSPAMNHLLPPPLYDMHIMEWQEITNASEKIWNVTEEMANKYKANHIKELIERNKEVKKRREETMNRFKELGIDF